MHSSVQNGVVLLVVLLEVGLHPLDEAAQLPHRQLQRLHRVLRRHQRVFLPFQAVALLLVLLLEGHRPEPDFPAFLAAVLGLPAEVVVLEGGDFLLHGEGFLRLGLQFEEDVVEHSVLAVVADAFELPLPPPPLAQVLAAPVQVAEPAAWGTPYHCLRLAASISHPHTPHPVISSAYSSSG